MGHSSSEGIRERRRAFAANRLYRDHEPEPAAETTSQAASKAADGYEIGYKKPPKHSQFKKGQIANPLGRPRGAKSLSTLVDEALSAQIEQQQHSLEDAEVAHRLAEKRYEAGLSTYLTVLNTETAVLSARRARIALVSDRAIACIRLLS